LPAVPAQHEELGEVVGNAGAHQREPGEVPAGLDDERRPSQLGPVGIEVGVLELPVGAEVGRQELAEVMQVQLKQSPERGFVGRFCPSDSE